MRLKISLNKIDEKILDEAVAVLKNGGVIIYPTDTAYAMGCDAANEMAVEKIYRIKQRTKAKSMPVVAGSFDMAKKYFIFSGKEKELAKKFWVNTPLTPCHSTGLSPLNRGELGDTLKRRNGLKKGTADELEKGKLSLVLKAKKNVTIAESVIADDGTVAARVPNSIWVRALSLKLKKPIVSTSANLAGAESCYSVADIKKTGVAYRDVDLILDAEKLPRIMPSTIVRVKNGKVEVLREGSGGKGVLCI